jgi:uncharacterized membrane protein
MAEETPSRELLENLIERLDHLERTLQAQTARLYQVERSLGIEPPPRPQRAGPSSPGAFAPPPRRAPTVDESDTSQTPRAVSAVEPDAADVETDASHVETDALPFEFDATGSRASQPPRDAGPSSGQAGARYSQTNRSARAGQYGPPPRHAPAQRRDIESVIGGSVFAWVGIIAGVVAVGFFLKEAFEREWIGPGARCTLGALGGLALLGTGERLRARGLRSYAFVLSGGGLLILYLSIYASYNFYQLLDQPVAFLLMAIVTAGAVLLSVRLNARAVAILGLVGGFLTPILISTGRDNQVALFTYVALLDAGVLAVAYFKRWRSLDFLSFAATVLMTLGWAAKFYERGKFWTTLGFLTLFFVLYSLLAVFHNVLPRRRSRWFDLALLAWNASLYFGFTYLLLVDVGMNSGAPASLALLLCAYFTALFYAARLRLPEDRLLAYGYVGAAVTFFTAAVAIQLELQWVTVVWAVEALALTWVGLRSGESAARRSALVVFTAGVMHWLALDMQEFAYAGGEFVPLLNPRALSCASLVVSLGASAWLYRRSQFVTRGDADEGRGAGEGPGREEGFEEKRAAFEEERAAAASALSLAANGLAVTLLSLDLSDYFQRRKAGSDPLGIRRAENARQFSLTALWSVYGATLVGHGVRRRVRALRYAGFALLVIATIKVLALDLTFYDAVWHVPVLNHTFMAFALVVAAYAFALRLYARDEGLGSERSVVPPLTVIANVLALVALSAEAAGYFDSGAAAGADAARVHDLELAKQLSLSVIWALYGAGLLLAGRVWRVRMLRLMALALLSLTALKVFFWDLSSLDRIYRIVSFIVLGAILLAVSYLYQKSQQREARLEDRD